jgi:CheY-like chemotaxis protein
MVEDNADIIDLLRLFLASFSQNLVITTSRDGLEAVELMAQNTYDMLVLDIMLPQVSGLEVLERIRKSPKNSAVPILVLTGHREAARQAMNIGANDFLLKPFDKSTFIHKVLSLLGMERRKVPRAG